MADEADKRAPFVGARGKRGYTMKISPKPPPPMHGVSSVTTNASRPFNVSTRRTEPQQVDRVGTTPFEKLRARQIDAAQYAELKIQEATAHLGGLAATDRDFIRRMLADQLQTDPMLKELFQLAIEARR